MARTIARFEMLKWEGWLEGVENRHGNPFIVPNSTFRASTAKSSRLYYYPHFSSYLNSRDRVQRRSLLEVCLDRVAMNPNPW